MKRDGDGDAAKEAALSARCASLLLDTCDDDDGGVRARALACLTHVASGVTLSATQIEALGASVSHPGTRLLQPTLRLLSRGTLQGADGVAAAVSLLASLMRLLPAKQAAVRHCAAAAYTYTYIHTYICIYIYKYICIYNPRRAHPRHRNCV